VTNLPTIIKVTDNVSLRRLETREQQYANGRMQKWEKLVEGDVYDQRSLDAFVGE
jgi:hypothetical protein